MEKGDLIEPEVFEAIMMSQYHQPYSEIKKIPITKMLYYIILFQTENDLIKQENDKLIGEVKKKRKRNAFS